MGKEQMFITISVDLKKGTIHHKNWKEAVQEQNHIPLELEDLMRPVDQYASEYDALSDKLHLFCKIYKIDFKRARTMIAVTPLVRLKTICSYLQVAQYIAQKMFDILMQHESAMVIYQAGLRKTTAFAEYLRERVSVTTVSSTETLTRKGRKYHLPTEHGELATLDSMSVEELGEELRVAEEMNAPDKVLEKLRHYSKLAKARDKATHVNGAKTEHERVMSQIRDDEKGGVATKPKAKRRRR